MSTITLIHRPSPGPGQSRMPEHLVNGKCENLLSNNEEYEFNKCVKS